MKFLECGNYWIKTDLIYLKISAIKWKAPSHSSPAWYLIDGKCYSLISKTKCRFRGFFPRELWGEVVKCTASPKWFLEQFESLLPECSGMRNKFGHYKVYQFPGNCTSVLGAQLSLLFHLVRTSFDNQTLSCWVVLLVYVDLFHSKCNFT